MVVAADSMLSSLASLNFLKTRNSRETFQITRFISTDINVLSDI